MITHRWSLLLLPLVFLLLTKTSGVESQLSPCAMPELEPEFCTVLNAACMTTTNKLCLAKAMSTCMADTGLPPNYVEYLYKYLTQFISKIMSQIVTPTLPTIRPQQPATPIPTRVVTLPPRPSNPTPLTQRPSIPPPSPPRISNPPPFTTPYWPYSTYQPLGPVSARPNPPEPYTYRTTATPTTEIFSTVSDPNIKTGNQNLDLLFGVMSDLRNDQIIYWINVMIANMVDPGWVSEKPTQDVQYILSKVMGIFNYYHYYVDVTLLDTNLRQLQSSNLRLFNLFATLIGTIYIRLHIPEVDKASSITGSSNLDMYAIFFTDFASRRNVGLCHETINPQLCERYCTDDYGNNWIGIQARDRASEFPKTFDRPMEDYVKGFGDWNTGYWMGLECLHALTTAAPHELLVELADVNGKTALAHYQSFLVGDKKSGYVLQLGAFLGGAAGDSLRHSSGQQFTTRDHDVDGYITGNCAVKHEGGWWYRNCQINSTKDFLNGYFSKGQQSQKDLTANHPNFGVRWQTFNTTYVIVATRMFVRQSSNPLQGASFP